MKKLLIILVVILTSLGAAAGFAYGSFVYKPTYMSKSKLVVQNPKTTNQASDYANLATADSVLGPARDKAGMSGDIEDIRRLVTVKNVTGTNVIEVMVTTDSANKSRALNRAITERMRVQAELLYQGGKVVEVDSASPARRVGGSSPLKQGGMGAALGLALGIAVAFIFYPSKRTDDAVVPSSTAQTKVVDSGSSVSPRSTTASSSGTAHHARTSGVVPASIAKPTPSVGRTQSPRSHPIGRSNSTHRPIAPKPGAGRGIDGMIKKS